jgi:hypothetical protein
VFFYIDCCLFLHVASSLVLLLGDINRLFIAQTQAMSAVALLLANHVLHKAVTMQPQGSKLQKLDDGYIAIFITFLR